MAGAVSPQGHHGRRTWGGGGAGLLVWQQGTWTAVLPGHGQRSFLDTGCPSLPSPPLCTVPCTWNCGGECCRNSVGPGSGDLALGRQCKASMRNLLSPEFQNRNHSFREAWLGKERLYEVIVSVCTHVVVVLGVELRAFTLSTSLAPVLFLETGSKLLNCQGWA